MTGSLARTDRVHAFGASAPLKALQTKFGFTPDAIIEAARDQLERRRNSA